MIREFIQQCLNYPSGDNSQPFRFRISSAESFEIFFLHKIAAHRLNFDNQASLLSFGTLLETIHLVSLREGMEAKVTIVVSDFKNTQDEALWARVKLVAVPSVSGSVIHSANESKAGSATADDLMLARAIDRRGVDRGSYAAKPLVGEVLEWLHRESQRAPKLKLHIEGRLAQDIKSLVLEIEGETWRDLRISKDILKWIRFGKKEIQQTRDGLTWQSLKISLMDLPTLWLLQRFPWLLNLMISIVAFKNTLSLKQQLRATGAFGWIAADRRDVPTLIAVGRLYFRIWVGLNARGYGFQPMTYSTLPGFQAKFSHLDSNWSPKLLIAYRQLQKTLGLQAQWPESYVAVWGFRTGETKALLDSDRCLRKFIDDVLLDT